MYKQRLELDWVGKDQEQKIEPRILIKTDVFGSHDSESKNRLIHGDNLLALKALETDSFAGKVKLCFIDPPYNTGSAFKHYDDGVEHSIWLSLMKPRLESIRRLLAADGSLWITINDDECHYLKVLCDEVFGRQNFIANVVWQKKFSPQNDAKWFSDMHDHILIYAKNKEIWRPNRIEGETKASKSRKNLDSDPRGDWVSTDYTCNKSKDERPNLYYEIINPNTKEKIWPKETAVWRFSKEKHLENVKNNLVYWGKSGANSVPRYKNFKPIDENLGSIPTTIWLHTEVGNTQEAKKEAIAINKNDPFATPKPERLLKRIIQIGSNEGDLVLDSFAGSGTTGAVAHKMKRHWIMVEQGDQYKTHIIPRMKAIVAGEDKGAATESENWSGGGGFTYFELAPSLLQKDSLGNWIISQKYNALQLAEAVCKHEGFKFWPDQSLYWKQGYSTEKDFIFVTTEFLTADRLDRISTSMKPDETLLICAKAFKVPANKYPNITIKKIPQMLLGRCEFGRDDYSLNVKEPIQDELSFEEVDN